MVRLVEAVTQNNRQCCLTCTLRRALSLVKAEMVKMSRSRNGVCVLHQDYPCSYQAKVPKLFHTSLTYHIWHCIMPGWP